MTPALSEELRYCQGLTQQPLLDKLRSLRLALLAAATNADALRPLMASIRLICRIFYSLNSLGLTDVRTRGASPDCCHAAPFAKLLLLVWLADCHWLGKRDAHAWWSERLASRSSELGYH